MSSSSYSAHNGMITPTERSPRAPPSIASPDYRMFLHDVDEQGYNKPSPGFRVVNESQGASALQDMESSEILLLLTPVVAPDSSSSRRTDSRRQDPFEIFGRKLSKRHARIRHVPYIAKVGLTSTHRAFLHEADAIVYVTLDDADSRRNTMAISSICSTTESNSPAHEQSDKPVVHLQYRHEERRSRADSPRDALIEAMYPTEHQFDEAVALLFSSDS